MTPCLKRLAFPLVGPRQLTWAWWPVHAYAAAVDAYYWAFFACGPLERTK